MRTLNNTPTCMDGHDHRLIVRRQRGLKVRMQCVTCNLWGPWQPVTKADPVAQAKAVEQGEAPSGSVVVKVTGDNSMHTRAQHDHKEVMDATFWNGATVADLKAMCKARGITGYSKMKRDDLLVALGQGA